MDELMQKLYDALQAISGCPGKCKCCESHEKRMREALAEAVKRWTEQHS